MLEMIFQRVEIHAFAEFAQVSCKMSETWHVCCTESHRSCPTLASYVLPMSGNCGQKLTQWGSVDYIDHLIIDVTGRPYGCTYARSICHYVYQLVWAKVSIKIFGQSRMGI
jgi:hypothetical protein